MSLKRWLARRAQAAAYYLLQPVIAPIIHEISRAHLPERETVVKNPIQRCGRRFFSQNDEDGILLEILRRLQRGERGCFLEFGVGAGTECNTIILLALGWRGAWIGDEALSFDLPEQSRLAYSRTWITRENAADLAKETLVRVKAQPADVGVISVDIDGNDGAIVRTLLANEFTPDVFVVEYNAKFPPPVEFEMPYNAHSVWSGGDHQGVSLQRWVSILAPAGYKLVACNDNGINAFFVRDTFRQEFSDVPAAIDDIYRIGHYRLYPRSGHETMPATIRVLAMDQSKGGFEGPEQH
jgi:hypothetical protein